MAKTLDVLVQEALGAQLLQILRLQAQIEAAQDEVARLSPKKPTDEHEPK